MTESGPALFTARGSPPTAVTVSIDNVSDDVCPLLATDAFNMYPAQNGYSVSIDGQGIAAGNGFGEFYAYGNNPCTPSWSGHHEIDVLVTR